MRWPSELRRRLGRAEVRLGLALGGSISLLVVALLAVLFLVSTHEAAELRAEVLLAELREVQADLAKGTDPASVDRNAPGISIRRVGPGGESQLVAGHWPSGRAFRGGTPSLELVLASRDDYLSEHVALGGGGRLEGALSLDSFVAERSEQLGAMLKSFAIGLLGIFAVSMLLTRIALAPLRETTRAIESVDERNLGARLALRGTDDDIDRLGKALNRVFERLENAFARMRSYGADVAHELRTPLNRLVNLVDVALLPNSGERAERTLEAVREATQEMQRLIEDMLLLARGEEERLRLLPEKLDLVAAARDLVELYSPACDERGVTLALTAAPGASELETDRSLLQRALANLLDNAVRHTPSGGRIDVTVAVEGERATISVDDSGPGIAAAERERVFERFVQLDPARGHSGAGLGLPIARMIARLLGGSLTVSDSPLGGARLQLALRSLGSSRIHAR